MTRPALEIFLDCLKMCEINYILLLRVKMVIVCTINYIV